MTLKEILIQCHDHVILHPDTYIHVEHQSCVSTVPKDAIMSTKMLRIARKNRMTLGFFGKRVKAFDRYRGGVYIQDPSTLRMEIAVNRRRKKNINFNIIALTLSWNYEHVQTPNPLTQITKGHHHYLIGTYTRLRCPYCTWSNQ